MQDSASLAMLVVGKDAEISMLREQLAQLSSDLSRNLAVLSAKEGELEEASNAVTSLTAVLAEKDELFAQYEEQVAALEALRQKEAAECKQLQAALANQQREYQQQLQTEQSKREKLQQQLTQLEESSTAQVQSARQAAVTQAVQHSSQHKAELERAAGQHQQLKQQLQDLQQALAAKEAEVASVQVQLAAALGSTQRVQANHGKSMASKTALVAQMQQQLEESKAGYTHANRAHEAHIGQLISSINEMQELTSKQAAELQQYAAGHKAQQQELQALQQTAKRHEEARSKAEMRKSAMEAALQQEVTAHAAVKAHHGLLQDCVACLLVDLQEQHSRASSAAAQLSMQLSQAQEQMVCAAVSQQPSPQRAHVARALEEQCQCLSADMRTAQERTACLAAICAQLSQQLAPLLTAESFAKQPTGAPASPAKAAPAAMSPQRLNSCMAALTQSLQQQQLQQQQQQQRQPPLMWQQRHGAAAVQACCTQPAAAAATAWPSAPACTAGCHCNQQPQQGAAAPAGVDSHQVFVAAAAPAGPQHIWTQAHPPGHLMQSAGVAACEAGAGAYAGTPADLRQQHNLEWSPASQHQQYLQSPAKVCVEGQGWTPSRPGAVMASSQPSSPLPAATTAMQPLRGLVGQLQAGVARLQQQLGGTQQQMTQHVQPIPDMQLSPHRSRAHPSHAGGGAGCCQQDHQVTTLHALQQQQVGYHSTHRARPTHQHSHRQHMRTEADAAPGPPPLHSAATTRQYTYQGRRHHHQQEGDVPQHQESSSSSVCGSEGSRSTISCSAEVAAAVAAARRRLQHQGSPSAWAASGPAGSTAAAGRAGGCAAGKGLADPPGAAALAALASSTLKKLELLSNESPAWC